MKKLLLTLLVLLSFGFVASAAEVEFNPMNKTTGQNGLVSYNIVSNSGNSPSEQSDHVRIYFKNKLTVESSGAAISKLSFVTTASNYNGSTFHISADGSSLEKSDFNVSTSNTNVTVEIYTPAKKIELTNGLTGETNKQFRTKSMTVTLVDEGPQAPVITARTGQIVYDANTSNEIKKGTEVTFTVNNYTDITAFVGNAELNETDFTNGSYTATINEDTEVIIDAYNGELENEVSYTFTVKEDEPVTPVEPVDPSAPGEWVLVTDASDLAAGNLLIIANTKAGKAMATTENANNRKIVDVTISKGILTYSTAPLILKLDGQNGAWTLHTTNYEGDNGYLASATTGKNNHLKVQAKAMEASISISGNNAAIKFDAGTFDRVNLRYNSSSSLFACYNGGQDDVQIFKFVELPATTIKGLTCEVDRVYKNTAYFKYMLHVDNHYGDESGSEYKVVLTVNEKPFQGEHSLMIAASAPRRELSESDVPSTHTFAGNVGVDGLEGLTPYTATLHVEHNGKIVEEHTISDIKFETTNTTGIEDVTVDGNEAAEYFNLQGVRVAQPEAGRIYIVRRGAKVAKELVK